MATAPDWNHWLDQYDWDVEDAVCLSLDLEPRDPATQSLVRNYRPSMRFRDGPINPLYDRLIEVAKATDFPAARVAINSVPVPMRVLPEDFALWATKASWQLPAELRVVAATSNTSAATVAETEAAKGRAKAALRRERESLLKLVIGMAIGRYHYDATAARSTATREIVEDLQRHGLEMDEDTVRKWLREGTRLTQADNK